MNETCSWEEPRLVDAAASSVNKTQRLYHVSSSYPQAACSETPSFSKEVYQEGSQENSEVNTIPLNPNENAFCIILANGAFTAFKEIVLPKIKQFEVHHEPNAGKIKGRYLCRLEDKPAIEGIIRECNIKATYEDCFDAHFNKPRAERIADNENTKLRAKILRYMEMEQATDAEEIKLKSDIASMGKNEEDPAVIAARKKIAEKRNAAKAIHDEFEQTANGIKLLREMKEAGSESEVNLPFTVLGYNLHREMLVSHDGHLERFTPKQLTPDDLMFYVKSEILNDPKLFKELKNKLRDATRLGGRIDDEHIVGLGVSWIKNAWVIVSGKTIATISNGTFSLYNKPIIGGRIIELSSKDWVDFDELKRCIEKEDPQDLLSSVFEELAARASGWNWEDPTMGDYFAAFQMLAPVQQAMVWRAWLWIYGPRGCGKSTLAKQNKMTWGGLAVSLDKCTEHSAAQAIGFNSAIPILDEFENSVHVEKVLNFLMMGNSGGVKLSGNPSRKSYRYEISHMPWMFSINQPRCLNENSAQQSRVIKFKLNPLVRTGSKKSIKPRKFSEDEAKQFAARALAAVIMNWDEINRRDQLLHDLEEELAAKREGLEIRHIDNFGLASSLINLARKTDLYTVPLWAEVGQEGDSDKALNTILCSLVKWDSTQETVQEIVARIVNQDAEHADAAKKILAQYGMAVSKHGGQMYLALHSSNVSRQVLIRTDYVGVDLTPLLLRIKGAITKRVDIGRIQQRCVVIPIDVVMGSLGQPDKI